MKKIYTDWENLEEMFVENGIKCTYCNAVYFGKEEKDKFICPECQKKVESWESALEEDGQE